MSNPREYAIINDFVVTAVQVLEEEQVLEASQANQFAVDITDCTIKPVVGWVISGNQLIAPISAPTPITEIIKATIRKFQKAAPELLIQLYTANTLAGITTVQSDAMFTEYQDVLTCIREGAWPTALYRLNNKQPSGFVTQQMIDSWKNLLITGMQS
jgi:hypothetical protein